MKMLRRRHPLLPALLIVALLSIALSSCSGKAEGEAAGEGLALTAGTQTASTDKAPEPIRIDFEPPMISDAARKSDVCAWKIVTEAGEQIEGDASALDRFVENVKNDEDAKMTDVIKYIRNDDGSESVLDYSRLWFYDGKMMIENYMEHGDTFTIADGYFEDAAPSKLTIERTEADNAVNYRIVFPEKHYPENSMKFFFIEK